QGGRGANHPGDLLERQDLDAGQEGVVAAEHRLGHAVRAAEVAPVGHRDAQVPQRTAEAVSHPTGRLARSRTTRIGRNHRPTTWHRDTSHPGATLTKTAAAPPTSDQASLTLDTRPRSAPRPLPGAALRR